MKAESLLLRRVFGMGLMCALFLIVPYALAGQSPLDGFNPNANGAVRALAAQSDGKILVGGDFTAVSGAAANRITRLLIDGTSDTTFVCPGTNDSVLAIAVQANDKFLIGGKFTQIGGTARTYIARLNRNGSLDATFNAALNGAVTGIAVQGDGKIVCVGQFTSTSPTTHNRVTRLNSNGSADTSFNPGAGADNTVNALTVQKDGRIVIGGRFSHVGGSTRNRIARMTSNGSLDTTFDPGTGPNAAVYSVTIQADGKILVGGAFTTPLKGIVRLTASGAVDAAFNIGSGADGEVMSIAAQPDGKIVAAGAFTTMSGSTCRRIARLKLDGSLDSTFACAGTSDTVHAVMVQSDGKIALGGEFTQAQGTGRNRIARLYPGGGLDTNYQYVQTDTVETFAFQPDGKALVSAAQIVRCNLDGSMDPSFTPNSGASAFAIQRNGVIITHSGGSRIRLSPTGRRDWSYRHCPVPTIDLPKTYTFNFVLCPDDWLIYDSAGSDGWNIPDIGFARIKPDGSADSSFLPEAHYCGTMALQPDQKIVMTHCGTNRNLRRFNANGSLDATFDIGADKSYPNFYSVLLQPDGKVVVGGGIRSIGNVRRNAIARLMPDGKVDTAFNCPLFPPNEDAYVIGVAQQSNGKILALAWRYDATTTYTFPRLVRLNPDGSPDPTFDPIWTHAGDRFDAIGIQSDGKIMFGGRFDFTEGGKHYRCLARLANSEAALQKMSVSTTGRTVYWQLGGSYPWPYQVLFEDSADGTKWTKLGYGVPVCGFGYQLDGVHILRGHYIRATGYMASGGRGGSVSLTESVLWVGDQSVPESAVGRWADYE